MNYRVLLSAIITTTLLTVSGLASASEVNVYSYREPFLIKPLFDTFTRETGIKVNTVFAKKGLVERLTSEGINSPADLIFTVDIGRLDSALQAGVTQEVNSDILNKNIPSEFRDPAGHWFGLTNRARIIVSSLDRVGEDEIDTYESLADPKFAGRICTRSGKHAYMVALTASMIAHHGETETKNWLTGLKENLARKPQGNDRAQVKAIAEGECDIAIINHYYMALMINDEEQVAWADAVRIHFPNQADRGTHMNISGVALTQSAPNKDNAIKLMEFLSGDIAQQMYGEVNYEYPVNPGVPRAGLLASWGDFKHDTQPLSDIAKHRNTATKMVDEVGYDR
ncbi:MAG: Fe(3+) ABC transporter substrate-binding protein [Granulosicoccus sp.]|nr:Fe(3+) ABC transporter substrate-binding protein [Granulosicoccus sp.]